jgi:hypothetical protein
MCGVLHMERTGADQNWLAVDGNRDRELTGGWLLYHALPVNTLTLVCITNAAAPKFPMNTAHTGLGPGLLSVVPWIR